MDYLLHGSLIVIFLWLLIGGMGVPVPEDIAVLSLGVLIHRGLAEPVLALAIGFAGVLGGDAILFQIARRLGPRALDRPLFRRVLPTHRRARIEELFRRHGGRLVFFARHVAGLRASVFAMAGIHRMEPRRFYFFDALAAAISVPLTVLLGYYGSLHIDRMRADVARVEHHIFLGVLLLAVILFGLRHRRVLRRA